MARGSASNCFLGSRALFPSSFVVGVVWRLAEFVPEVFDVFPESIRYDLACSARVILGVRLSATRVPVEMGESAGVVVRSRTKAG